MTPEDVFYYISWFRTAGWPAIMAVVIGGLTRLTKLEKVAAKIPPPCRLYTAIVLGQATAVVDLVANGTPWRQAAVRGVVATALAVFVHQFGIEGLRKGVELFAPPRRPPQDRETPTDPGGSPPAP